MTGDIVQSDQDWVSEVNVLRDNWGVILVVAIPYVLALAIVVGSWM